MITENKEIYVNSDIIIDEVDDELIIFNPVDEKTHILNSIGKYLIQNANGDSIVNISKKLYEELDETSRQAISFDKLYSDILSFIETLVQQNLIELKDGK